jgi:Mg-chelatase subunit ChlD
MNGRRDRFRLVDDDRGVSEVVGYVLLIGVVTVGIMSILLLGGSLIDDLKGQIGDESRDVSLDSANERLSALSGSRVNSTRFELRGTTPSDVRVLSPSSSGHISLTVDGGACTARLPLSAIEYDRGGSRGVVALQAGGRFVRAGESESSAVLDPPAFTADNGTIDVTTYNLTGHVDDSTVEILKNETLSTNRSLAVEQRLTTAHPTCSRPENVTVTVHSAYYQAWASHLEGETGVAATTDPTNDTATVHLDQEWLPGRANDSANHVVNLSDDAMAQVRSNGAPTSAPSYNYSTTTDNLQVDKGVGNSYTAIALPLGNGTQSSYTRQVSGATVYRRPIDIVFVVDESGSMDDSAGAGGGSKSAAAKQAAKNFTGAINTSSDRVAFVGFNYSGTYHRIQGSDRFFTNDTARANATIDTYDDDGGTSINLGLDKANTVHDFRERPGAQKVVIVLSDGMNSYSVDDGQTLEQARRANENNVTIFAVGFGDESAIDDELLSNVSNETGGTYRFADNATELDSVFQDILSNITSVRAIVHRPTTAQLSIGGQRVRPKLGYSNPNINRINGSYDINDPRYRGGFEFSASAADGNLINVTAVSYECQPDALQITDVFVTNQTTNQTYRRVRCTDVENASKTVVSPDEAQVFLDGANVSQLPDDDETWYQSDLVNDTLDPYLSGGELELESNEAVIVFEYSTGGETSRIVLLYQIGLSESTAAVDIFDVREVAATVGN